MSMDDDSGDGKVLMAEYVLGLLDAASHDRLTRRIENDPALRAERDFWLARLSTLDGEFEPANPSPRVWAGIEARLFGAPRRESWWDSLSFWRSAAAGAAAIAVAAIGLNLMQPAPDVSSLATQLVAALEAEGSDVRFIALYDGSGAVRLTALSGAPVPDKDLELWAIQGGKAPVSMGVIPIGQSTVPIGPDIAAEWGAGSILAITLEQKGGSPDGTPKGPVVAQGVATQI